MKAFVIILISLYLNIFVKCSECGTPAECYIRAIAILQNDREEMRRLNDNLSIKIDNLNKQIETLNTKNINMEAQRVTDVNNINIHFGQVETALKIDVDNINNHFVQVETSVKNKNCYLARGIWAQCPYGGTYRGGAIGHNAGINEQNTWADGSYFLCCN